MNLTPVDVLVVSAGPTGLTLAAQLAGFGSAARAPGPLRAFYNRIKTRRGFQVAATVATARKLTVLCWHLVTKNHDYAFVRPSLNAHKRRKLELAAGAT
jgi:transposase